MKTERQIKATLAAIHVNLQKSIEHYQRMNGHSREDVGIGEKNYDAYNSSTSNDILAVQSQQYSETHIEKDYSGPIRRIEVQVWDMKYIFKASQREDFDF